MNSAAACQTFSVPDKLADSCLTLQVDRVQTCQPVRWPVKSETPSPTVSAVSDSLVSCSCCSIAGHRVCVCVCVCVCVYTYVSECVRL